MTGRVSLEGLEFHAFHGVHAYERESGNKFEVDIHVDTDFSAGARKDDIHGTVDYEILYRIVKEEMEKPSKLLETVAEKIVEDVFRELPAVLFVELKISKINPPIGGKCERASVRLSKSR